MRDIARGLACPVCQGLSVADSPSQLATQMRELILQKVEDGETREQIVQYFVDRYGAKATLFVVGTDLKHDQVRNVLRDAIRRGHAIANHTQDHLGDFGDCDPTAKARPVALAGYPTPSTRSPLALVRFARFIPPRG